MVEPRGDLGLPREAEVATPDPPPGPAGTPSAPPCGGAACPRRGRPPPAHPARAPQPAGRNRSCPPPSPAPPTTPPAAETTPAHPARKQALDGLLEARDPAARMQRSCSHLSTSSRPARLFRRFLDLRDPGIPTGARPARQPSETPIVGPPPAAGAPINLRLPAPPQAAFAKEISRKNRRAREQVPMPRVGSGPLRWAGGPRSTERRSWERSRDSDSGWS